MLESTLLTVTGTDAMADVDEEAPTSVLDEPVDPLSSEVPVDDPDKAPLEELEVRTVYGTYRSVEMVAPTEKYRTV